MKAEWNRLVAGMKDGTLTGSDRKLAKKLAHAVQHLQDNPFHPGLQSHEISALSARYGQKVFESYLENNTPAAGRIFWVYGPRRHFITLIGMEPHPPDSKRGHARVLLSRVPAIEHGDPLADFPALQLPRGTAAALIDEDRDEERE